MRVVHVAPRRVGRDVVAEEVEPGGLRLRGAATAGLPLLGDGRGGGSTDTTGAVSVAG